MKLKFRFPRRPSKQTPEKKRRLKNNLNWCPYDTTGFRTISEDRNLVKEFRKRTTRRQSAGRYNVRTKALIEPARAKRILRQRHQSKIQSLLASKAQITFIKAASRKLRQKRQSKAEIKSMDNTINYRSLKKYKYQMMEDYTLQLPADFIPENRVNNMFIWLSEKGKLTILLGYAWDGPSGPTIDTKSFMRGSLVHDALFQLMREGKLPQSCFKPSNKLLVAICREDGMSWIRAKGVYLGVAGFSRRFAKPKK